jgi:hypothetical protein
MILVCSFHILTLATPVKIVDIAGTAPKKAGRAVYARKQYQGPW